MSETRADSFTIYIDKILNSSFSTPSKTPMCRVDGHLRSINSEDYDPKIIAIGPFHCGKPQLEDMERHKVRYLNLFLGRIKESEDRYFTKIRDSEERARKCYTEDIDLDKDEFMKMLICDGCFIVVFLLALQCRDYIDRDDPIFQSDRIQNLLLRDLMVFENQIPFYIIESLFGMIKVNFGDIYSLIWPLVENAIFPLRVLPEVPLEAHHLLGIVYDIHSSSFKKILSQMDTRYPKDLVNIYSAVELKEAGISFKKSEGDILFHIEFKNRAMIIPEWEFFDSTESVFRNLMAYEDYLTDSPQKYVKDYVFFMKCLIKTPEDLKLLRHYGIIRNMLDEEVYRVINQLGNNIVTSDKFLYSNIFNTVNLHYGPRMKRWMAILRQKYFKSPWALISVFASITLLVLGIIQAVFAILSYCNDLKRGS